MFEKAARLRLRFVYCGNITAEDLFDLSLTKLNGIYVSLKKEQDDTSVTGLLELKTKESAILDLKIEIVKYVFESKKLAEEKAKARTGIKMHNQKILELIDDKQNQERSEKSIDELKSLLVDEDVDDALI
jgi:hypothetical protein